MRERILATAAEILEMQGVKFTMSELAQQLGVSKRCIYEHFQSKEELIEAILKKVFYNLREIRQEILQNTELTLEEKVKALLTTRQTVFPAKMGRGAAKIRTFFPKQCAQVDCFKDEWLKTIEVLIQEGMDTGQFRPIYLPIVRKMIRGTLNEILDYSFIMEQQVSFNDMMDAMADIMLYGMVQQPKQKLEGIERR